ncbi:hypothetical protein BDZ91DRAFT_768300 [Kalaharituber pfeilii]|nr:hypothetical protein BDZ91DRAFT_768300 [Kalaharituber pfeilii]
MATAQPSLAQIVEATIASMPPLHRQAPLTGEQFAYPADCLARLQDYAFSQGFAVTKPEALRKLDLYVWHLQDKRNLDTMDATVGPVRQRHTPSRAMDCHWTARLTFKSPTSGASKTWVLTILLPTLNTEIGTLIF